MVRLRTAAAVVVARVAAELAAVAAVPVATEATDKILSRLVCQCTVLY